MFQRLFGQELAVAWDVGVAGVAWAAPRPVQGRAGSANENSLRLLAEYCAFPVQPCSHISGESFRYLPQLWPQSAPSSGQTLLPGELPQVRHQNGQGIG